MKGNHAGKSLVKNLLRENLTHLEKTETLDKIMKDHGHTWESQAGIIGKARSTVTEILSLNRCPGKSGTNAGATRRSAEAC